MRISLLCEHQTLAFSSVVITFCTGEAFPPYACSHDIPESSCIARVRLYSALLLFRSVIAIFRHQTRNQQHSKMLRLAARSQELKKLGSALLQSGATRSACSSSAASTDSSISNLINAVKNSNSATFASGGLNSLKSTIQPKYPACGSKAMSTEAKVALLAVTGYVLYRADMQAKSHEWIVDLSLNVLQSAWWISFLSFLPFRSIYFSLRGIAPHTAGPLNALRPAINIKP